MGDLFDAFLQNLTDIASEDVAEEGLTVDTGVPLTDLKDYLVDEDDVAEEAATTEEDYVDEDDEIAEEGNLTAIADLIQEASDAADAGDYEKHKKLMEKATKALEKEQAKVAKEGKDGCCKGTEAFDTDEDVEDTDDEPVAEDVSTEDTAEEGVLVSKTADAPFNKAYDEACKLVKIYKSKAGATDGSCEEAEAAAVRATNKLENLAKNTSEPLKNGNDVFALERDILNFKAKSSKGDKNQTFRTFEKDVKDTKERYNAYVAACKRPATEGYSELDYAIDELNEQFMMLEHSEALYALEGLVSEVEDAIENDIEIDPADVLTEGMESIILLETLRQTCTEDEFKTLIGENKTELELYGLIDAKTIAREAYAEDEDVSDDEIATEARNIVRLNRDANISREAARICIALGKQAKDQNYKYYHKFAGLKMKYRQKLYDKYMTRAIPLARKAVMNSRNKASVMNSKAGTQIVAKIDQRINSLDKTGRNNVAVKKPAAPAKAPMKK